MQPAFNAMNGQGCGSEYPQQHRLYPRFARLSAKPERLGRWPHRFLTPAAHLWAGDSCADCHTCEELPPHERCVLHTKSPSYHTCPSETGRPGSLCRTAPERLEHVLHSGSRADRCYSQAGRTSTLRHQWHAALLEAPVSRAAAHLNSRSNSSRHRLCALPTSCQWEQTQHATATSWLSKCPNTVSKDACSSSPQWTRFSSVKETLLLLVDTLRRGGWPGLCMQLWVRLSS